jgi:hypothetical protein
MEKLIITAILMLISCIGIAQVFVNARINTTDSTYEWFLTGIVPPAITPTYMKTKRELFATFKHQRFQLSLFDSTKNDGPPKRIAWLDNFGNFKISPTSSFTAAAVTLTAITNALGGTPIVPSGTSSQYYRGNGTLATFPTIPAAQVNTDWNSVSGLSQILNKPDLTVYYLANNPNNYISTYTETDPVWSGVSGNYYTKTQTDGRYLQSFTESDPIWTASPSFSITGTSISNWNTAFGWGNHANAGYLTASSANVLTNKSGNISQWTNNSGYISGITSGNVTSALGYTPYNVTNPNSYISSYTPTLGITGGSVYAVGGNSVVIPAPVLSNSQVTLALGATPLFTQTPQVLTYTANTLQLSGSGGIVVITPTLSAPTITAGLGYIPYDNANPNGYISSYTETDPQFNTKFGLKTTTDLTEGTNLYLTAARTRTALSQGTGISYNNSTGVITNSNPDQNVVISSSNTVLLNVTSSYPSFTLTPYSPTTFTASRAINSVTFQCSATKPAWVYYTIRINCVATIGGASSGTVALQYSSDNGSSWVDVGQVENSNTVTLAVVLNSSTTQTGQIAGVIPTGAIVRMNQSSSGTTTITFVRGQETY